MSMQRAGVTNKCRSLEMSRKYVVDYVAHGFSSTSGGCAVIIQSYKTCTGIQLQPGLAKPGQSHGLRSWKAKAVGSGHRF
jgi:hypothetical protein